MLSRHSLATIFVALIKCTCAFAVVQSGSLCLNNRLATVHDADDMFSSVALAVPVCVTSLDKTIMSGV